MVSDDIEIETDLTFVREQWPRRPPEGTSGFSRGRRARSIAPSLRVRAVDEPVG
jgi:hypothetical protein